MFCKYCGNLMGDTDRFCPKCGKDNANQGISHQPKEKMHVVLLLVSVGLLLLSLLLALNAGDNMEVEDVILPAVLALGSVGLSGYVFTATKNVPEDKKTHTFSLVALIGGILMAAELCLGPLIGSLVG